MYRLLLVAFTGALGLFSVLLLNKYDSHSYVRAENILLAPLFFLMALGCIVIYMSVKDVTISGTLAEFKSFLGYKRTTLRLSDIRGYTIQIVRSKYGRESEILTLFSRDEQQVKLKGNLYNNYEELKAALTNEVSEDKALEARIQNRNAKISAKTMIAIGALIVACGYATRDKEIKPTTVTNVKAVVADELYHYKSRKGSSESLTIHLPGYPDFNFKISDLAFTAADSQAALAEIHPGDTVTVGITKEAYDKKIGKTMALTFFDKYFGYEHVKVYALRKNDREYLTVENYNQVVKKSLFFGMGFLGVAAFALLIFGTFALYKANKSTATLDSM